MKLSHINAIAARLFGNVALSKASTAIGTVKSGINTTGTLTYAIDGILRTLAALTSQALVTGAEAFRVQPANKTVYYVFAVNAAGTVRTFQGRWQGEPYTDVSGVSVVGDGSVPDIPDGWAPFGMAKVVTGATTFTPNTTLFDAANVTTTFYDLMCLPATDRP